MMNRLRSLRRQLFDIRPGEHLRTWSMFCYLLFVLFAYYILKPVSRAMFLTQFDPDKLPQLYILIAVFGGIFAYLYSKLAAKTSLGAAVFGVMSLSVVSLLAMWALIRHDWMIYVLNIWVSLFSIILVSQGWLVAGNLFDAREAKRLYPLLGMGMVLGAAFGGEFTNRTALLVGTRNLLLASAVMVILAYIAFRLAVLHSSGTVHQARAAREEETDFSFGTIVRDIGRVRHLQVIVGIMIVMYLVDTIVEYQFQVMARVGHRGDQLTAFFGQFYGLYLNLTEFVFQLFLTAAVVRRFGVGGTLQISPVTILLSSIATVVAPGVTSASAVRLTEASTRYTLNRTGMELLYMPLPLELRNRIKAFIDICVDRLSRGLGGVLLILLTATSLKLGVKGIAVVVMILCVPWACLAYLARREYVASIRRRFESRRLDFESARVSVSDQATIRLLEVTFDSENSRQAAYALGLLADAPRYDVRPLLEKALSRREPEVRAKAYEIAAALRYPGLKWGKPPLLAAEVRYAIAISRDRRRLTSEFLDNPDPVVAAAALETLREDPALAAELITPEWLDRNASAGDPGRRVLAIRAAGVLRDRAHLFLLIHALSNPRLRGDAIDALAAFGPPICGTLSDALLDEAMPARIRRQVPRVLRKIPHQRSVDVLIGAVGHQDLSIRSGVLKALNHLRETAPGLNFENTFVSRQILNEARYYYELSAALAPFRDRGRNERTAAHLLAATIEERLRLTLERLFRLLGLRYPPKEIYSAYLAVSRRPHEEATAALEFLDNTLERDLKKFLLPLLDAPEHLLEHGRELFGVEVRTVEEAVRELIRSRDPWLAACAMAAAAELGLRSLVPEIHHAARTSEEDVGEVARAAEARLAA